MLQIDCPWCGTRDETEFTYGGETHIARPPLSATDSEWTGYLYYRRNPRGLHYERWLHARGCGRWFNLVRDTLTHRIHAVYRMGDPRPDIEGGTT